MEGIKNLKIVLISNALRVPLHMIKGMQKISRVSESLLQKKFTTLKSDLWGPIFFLHHYISYIYIYSTNLDVELKVLPISMLSPFLVFVHWRPQTSHSCMQNIGTRIGFYTICDVTNHACRLHLWKPEFQWVQRKLTLSAMEADSVHTWSTQRTLTLRNKTFLTIGFVLLHYICSKF